jgi:hypothetical protein
LKAVLLRDYPDLRLVEADDKAKSALWRPRRRR